MEIQTRGGEIIGMLKKIPTMRFSTQRRSKTMSIKTLRRKRRVGSRNPSFPSSPGRSAEPCDSCRDTAHVVVFVFLVSHTLSQIHGKDDLGDQVDGMKNDTIMLFNGDDIKPKRGSRLLGGNDDIAGIGFPKLLNVAGVLMMSTHDFLLVVVFLHVGTGKWEPVDVRRGLVLLFIVRLVHLIFAVPQQHWWTCPQPALWNSIPGIPKR